MPQEQIEEQTADRQSAEQSTLPADSTSTQPPTHEFLRGYFASPFAWLAAFLVLNLCVPFLDIPNRATALAGVVSLTFAYVCIIVFFAVCVARKKPSIRQILMWGMAALTIWYLLDKFSPAFAAPIIAAARQTRTRPEGFALLQLIGLNTLTDCALMSMGVCAGVLAARLIRTPNMLGPICVVIALIDVWGVLFGGIVSQLLVKAPQLAEKAMTSGPQLGGASRGGFTIPLPAIGIGDYLFLGLLFGALFYLHLNWQAAIKWVVPLVAGALLAITFGLIPALPGLLFIALGVAIPNLDTFKFTREEKFALFYTGVFVAVLTGALYLGFKSVLAAHPPNGSNQKTQRK